MSDPLYKIIGSSKDRLYEELGEFMQAISKGERFGWNTCHPNRESSNNLIELQKEWADVKEAYKRYLKSIKVINYLK